MVFDGFFIYLRMSERKGKLWDWYAVDVVLNFFVVYFKFVCVGVGL